MRSRHPFVCRFAVAFFITAVSSLATAADVYVAKDGNDANPGTKEKPFATVEKAVAAMRGAGAGTIWIGPGEYYMKQGVAFDAKFGGTEAQPLVIRGLEPGKTRLTGARPITGFRPITADEAKPLISTEAKKHVVVADLKSQGIGSLSPMPVQYVAHGCEELVFGDVPMQVSRWPNEGFMEFTDVIDSGASGVTHWVQRTVYRPGSFRFPNDRPKQWDFSRGIWLHGFWCYEWSDEVLKAASYNPETGELRLAAKHNYGIGSPWKKKDDKRPFYAVNVFEELDEPGEYYLDRQNDRLYFWPPSDPAKTPARLTLCRQPLISANGVKHLIVRDLTLENTRGPAVVMNNGKQCSVENCLIRNLGRDAILMTGDKMAVRDCEITQTAGSGIHISGGDRKTLTPGKCEVTGCRIHHTGRLDWDGRGILLGGCGNRVANNVVHDGPAGAIAYGGNDQTLEFNETYNMCLQYADVGVFYTGRDWASQGNVVRWNYIHDVKAKGGFGAQAVYLDDCDSGDTIFGNIVFNCGNRAIVIGGGRDNTIKNNIFIQQPIGVHIDARGPTGIVFNRNDSWNLLAKCETLDYKSPLWAKRYPRLAKTMAVNPLQPMGNSIRDNIMIDCKKEFDLHLNKEFDDKWIDRGDNRLLTAKDFPGLIVEGEPAKLDLQKLPAVWKDMPGFKPIPIEKIGLPKK